MRLELRRLEVVPGGCLASWQVRVGISSPVLAPGPTPDLPELDRSPSLAIVPKHLSSIPPSAPGTASPELEGRT